MSLLFYHIADNRCFMTHPPLCLPLEGGDIYRISSPSRGGLRWGWVCILVQRPPDKLLHAFHPCHHLMIPKPQHPETGLLQKTCPLRVMQIFAGMLSAVNLNNNFPFEADEIKYVSIKWMLSPEFVSVKLLSP